VAATRCEIESRGSHGRKLQASGRHSSFIVTKGSAKEARRTPLTAHAGERELGISGINVTDSRSLLRLCRPLETRLGCNLHATLPRANRPGSRLSRHRAYREGI